MRTVILITIALAVAAPVWAQKMTLQQVEVALKRAGEYEAQNDFDDALRIYREVYAQYPSRSDVVMRMQSLLTRTGKHAEAAALLRRYLSQSPHDILIRLRLGEALLNQGKPDSAYAEWDRVAAEANNANIFALVADFYRKRNLDARAADIYRRARQTLHNPALFAQDMAEMAERQAHYDEAVREYLNLLDDRPQYRPLVEARLRDFAQEGKERDKIFDTLSGEVRAHPDDPTRLSLLVEYALPAGFTAQLLPLLLDTPGSPDNTWAYLFRVARQASDLGDQATAIKAYQALYDRLDRPDVRARALLGLAHADEALHRPDQAKERYQTVIERYPQRPEVDEARFYLAKCQRDADDLKAARKTLRDLIDANHPTPWRYRAMFELAESYIQADQFDQAEKAWLKVLDERPTGPEAGEARFHMAELQFLTGHIDTAQTMLKVLLAAEPENDAANDAIDLSTLIQEGQQNDPDLLRAYAAVLLQVRQHKTEAALKALQTLIAQHPDAFLIDRATFKQSELQEALGRYPQALQTQRELIANMPWSPYCPSAQMAMARIYESQLDQYIDAKHAYETLLLEYPLSLEADRARERLRALQQKIQTQESNKKAG